MPRGPNVECLAVREICSNVHDVDARTSKASVKLLMELTDRARPDLSSGLMGSSSSARTNQIRSQAFNYFFRPCAPAVRRVWRGTA